MSTGRLSSGVDLGDPEAVRDAIRGGDRRAVARTITKIESTLDRDQREARAILEALVPYTGGAVRLGITGPPGVGKSTFIEALGMQLIEHGHRVAVLAVDPSSPVTGGSILGDKTRMQTLSVRSEAFIRPSPSGGSLGGVAHRTRESMLVCEAAGYDVVLVETVGIGQSEVAVASMVDFFLVLLLPAGGDELQGIKKGVMELADAVVVNKADGSTRKAAERTAQDYRNALSLIRPSTTAWSPRALLASALEGKGIDEVWQTVLEHRSALEEAGEFASRRRSQASAWMWSLVQEGLERGFKSHPGVRAALETELREVQALKTTPAAAAERLLAQFGIKLER